MPFAATLSPRLILLVLKFDREVIGILVGGKPVTKCVERIGIQLDSMDDLGALVCKNSLTFRANDCGSAIVFHAGSIDAYPVDTHHIAHIFDCAGPQQR